MTEETSASPAGARLAELQAAQVAETRDREVLARNLEKAKETLAAMDRNILGRACRIDELRRLLKPKEE